jgi:hypothetical protein
MTFNIINYNDPVLSATAMQNWTHSNYGNDLLPMNATGVSVDNTLNLGGSSYRWVSIYSNGADIAGTATITKNNANGVSIQSASSNNSVLNLGVGTTASEVYIKTTKNGGGTTQPIVIYSDTTELARFKTTGEFSMPNGGKLEIGDTNLFRHDANVLMTDDTFRAAGFQSSDGSVGATISLDSLGLFTAGQYWKDSAGNTKRYLVFKNGLLIGLSDTP